MLLSARFILLLAGVGAFALAFMTVGDPNGMKIGVNVVYDVAIFCPLCYLYITRG